MRNELLFAPGPKLKRGGTPQSSQPTAHVSERSLFTVCLLSLADKILTALSDVLPHTRADCRGIAEKVAYCDSRNTIK